ncbi:hypothetical protein Cgig2_021677 [Carnegiea gigantea]|uniref:Uncharacterized protein n=1 Tax=Carnegiea gigantea TaxID=171969 RepID=A0A9Q1KTC4_9CARY|nr:hypothetical protein Cgig2_021677 [Carnegiea gigantea]
MLHTTSSRINARLPFLRCLSRMISRPCARPMILFVTEEAAQRFELPELPRVIFYAMLLNEAERLGVLHRRMLRIMESALTELNWGTFENEVRIFEAQFREKAEHEEDSLDTGGAAFPSGDDKQGKRRGGALHASFVMAFPPLHYTREMADFMKESFRWHWRSATCLPHLLLDDYQDLCPRFALSYATFYPILLNDAAKLGIVSGFLTVDLKLTLEGLRWTSFEAWLGHTSCNLREAQLRQRTSPSRTRGSVGGQKESSGSTGPLAPSSDEG